MIENEDREIVTDAFLDDFEDWNEDEERWKRVSSNPFLRDRQSAFRKMRGSCDIYRR